MRSTNDAERSCIVVRVETKRVYSQAEAADGARVLVDRLWPRGISRQTAQLTAWVKDVAPSHELRRWFDHDPARWEEFKRRYFAQLRDADLELTKIDYPLCSQRISGGCSDGTSSDPP